MKKLFKRLNIFTVLTLVVVLSMGARLNTLVDNFRTDQPIKVVSSASAVEKPAAPESGKAAVAPLEAPPGTSPEAAEILKEIRKNDALRESDTISEEDRIQQERGLPEFPVVTFSETELEVLQSLSQRRKDLENREKRLAQREALLSAAEQEVDRKIAELAALRAEIETLLGQQQKVQEGRLQSMVKIYETMKPQEAATIFNTLDMDVLLAVLSRMSERRSAPILADMNPDRARLVTIRLVEQSRLPDIRLPQN